MYRKQLGLSRRQVATGCGLSLARYVEHERGFVAAARLRPETPAVARGLRLPEGLLVALVELTAERDAYLGAHREQWWRESVFSTDAADPETDELVGTGDFEFADKVIALDQRCGGDAGSLEVGA